MTCSLSASKKIRLIPCGMRRIFACKSSLRRTLFGFEKALFEQILQKINVFRRHEDINRGAQILQLLCAYFIDLQQTAIFKDDREDPEWSL